MRILPILMIVVGAFMLLTPLGVVAWIYAEPYWTEPYADTYYVVAHLDVIIPFLLIAVALLAGGIWLLRRR